MAVSHQQPAGLPVRRSWASRLVVCEMWASLAIVVIWLAVLFDALFGPDIVSVSAGGSESARVPSAVVIALFAYLATHVVAKYGFGPRADRNGRTSEEDRT